MIYYVMFSHNLEHHKRKHHQRGEQRNRTSRHGNARLRFLLGIKSGLALLVVAVASEIESSQGLLAESAVIEALRLVVLNELLHVHGCIEVTEALSSQV